MIDPTTLPKIRAAESVSLGQQFEVRGSGFDLLPTELVLSDSNEYAITAELPTFNLLRLVSKTNYRMVFETTQEGTASYEHQYVFLASPFDAPRTIIPYDTLPLL